MQLRTLCLTLLATAIVAGCRSTPSQDPVEIAAASTATEAMPVPASTQADHAISEKRTQYLRQGSIHESARLVPPPPPPAAKSLAPSNAVAFDAIPPPHVLPANSENYAERTDNPVQRTDEQPVSTFSVDVDTGSYSNVRRMLQAGQRPPADAVRAEELINYFDHDHPAPLQRKVPLRVTTELSLRVARRVRASGGTGPVAGGARHCNRWHGRRLIGDEGRCRPQARVGCVAIVAAGRPSR